ncbi:hypothetical protein [Prauserella rugosa]|uniref:Uncharacterized protein n=1 Tax=Prauserella rugosa TaxID=43354 RepID=A0A660CGK5_9PSEU|nr:hypothetical protein [Prauserella rugosa]KID30660.1 hypothetical protein HQ32_02163 [Prauserella sp. Am3]KMS90119.1 hypothetical protein ACZ91_16715 [Streptomyces regensis]TWH20045.1 hypothetical protein JD82_01885 [Prauserella rugosa]
MNARRRADVTVHASVRAREITFLEQPETRISITGDADEPTSTSVTHRTGLPKPVRAHTRYLDIHVDHTTAADVHDPGDA